MRATRTVPENYSLRFDFDLKRDVRAGLVMQVVGVALFVAFGIVFGYLIQLLRPDINIQQNLVIASAIDGLVLVGALLGIMVITIILHELVHGLFFWIFTGELPKFGVGWGYAYAYAPGWYFPRRQYLVVGLAPLVVLSLIGFAVIMFVPLGWIAAIFWGMLVNASGAVGDLWITTRIALEPGDVLVQDTGDGFSVFGVG